MTKTQKRILWPLAVIFGLNLLLLLSGYRILLDEERGMDFTPYNRVTGSKKIGDTLSCTYWTGRSVQTATADAYDWKPDECPFFVKPAYLK